MSSVRGPEGLAGEFWKAMADTSIVENHNHLNPKYIEKTIPIGLHGDGGSFSKQDSLMVISWNSISGALGGSGFGKRFLYTIVRKRDMTDATLEAPYSVFSLGR